MNKIISLLLLISILASCNTTKPEFELDETYMTKFNEYWTYSPNLNYMPLVGLFEMKKLQANKFGSDKNNDFTMDVVGMPSILGSYSITRDSITYFAPDSLEVTNEEGEAISSYTYPILNGGKSKKLRHGQFYWFIHEVAGRPFLRVGDDKNPLLEEEGKYVYYPANADFIFNANYTPFDSPKEVSVPTIFDFEEVMTFIGTITFEYQGMQQTLEVCDNGFLMFSDETSALETYGSGRYINLQLPENGGEFVLDFNMAYNPPCSYSVYTVCKFPPTSNHLPFKVEAGEKYSDSKY